MKSHLASTQKKSDEDFDVTQVAFNPNEVVTLTTIAQNNPLLTDITTQATKQNEAFEEKLNQTPIDDDISLFTDVMKKQPKQYGIDLQFAEELKSLKLPQFFIEKQDELNSVLFEELNEDWELLHKVKLLDGFKLSNYGSEVAFDEISKDIIAIDFVESKGTIEVGNVNTRAKGILIDTILSKPKPAQLAQISSLIVAKLGDMYPIKQQELTRYVSRVFENLSPEQVRDVIDNDFVYVQKLKYKIQEFLDGYAQNRFKTFIASNKVKVQGNFTLPDKITPIKPSIPLAKSLYEREDDMNTLEQKMIMEIAGLANIKFWHRNLSRGKGFFINGFQSNHYPDFIIKTKKDNIILIETKGDHLDNDDSKNKRELGRVWAEKAGSNYKYFMVFENKAVENAYTTKSIIEVLDSL